jgi:hypothetical protein
MLAAVLAFLTSLALAGVAAYFSITGLMAIFAALPVSIAVMAGVLEVGKLVTASVLYRNWSTIPWSLKTYLSSAVVILMLITSLGIFGYLSKAHLDQNAPVSTNLARVERIEARIEQQERVIADADAEIEILDGIVATLIEYDKISGPDGSRAVRASQQEQRDELTDRIDAAQDRIEELQDEKFEYEQEVRDFETEVGPIKYIAALAYDNPADHYDSAVRGIILLLVFVFDPLAVLLLITANMLQMQHRNPNPDDPDGLEELFDPAEEVEHDPAPRNLVEFYQDPSIPFTLTEDDHPPPPPMPENTEWKEHDVNIDNDLGSVEDAFFNAEILDENNGPKASASEEPQELPWRIQVQEEWDEEEESIETAVSETLDRQEHAGEKEEVLNSAENTMPDTLDRERRFDPRSVQLRERIARQHEALERVAGSTDRNRVGGTRVVPPVIADVTENGTRIS